MSNYNEQPEVLWTNLIKGYTREIEKIAPAEEPPDQNPIGSTTFDPSAYVAHLQYTPKILNAHYFSPPTQASTPPVIYPLNGNAPTGPPGQLRKLEYLLGDDVSTEFLLEHNLGTKFITVDVFDVRTSQSAEFRVTRVDGNHVLLTDMSGAAPPLDTLGVVIIG